MLDTIDHLSLKNTAFAFQNSFPERKVYLRTYGCQMNEHDSQRILYDLSEMNFENTSQVEEADLILFNTCAIRDHANSKFYSHLGELKNLKQGKKQLKIGVMGCIAQTEGQQLLKSFRHLDFAFGTDVIDQVKEIVFRTYNGEEKFFVNAWDRKENYSIETKIVHGTPKAMVNIIKGCDKFCSYCIVPFTRGREKSRSVEEITTDVRRLVEKQGIQEIMLLGQNVNSFGKKNGESLAQLLYSLEEIEGLKLIRYTTSHPIDVSDELIEAHGKLNKLSKHLHLPVQSGSNSVLKKMLREYTVEHYMGLVEKLKKSQPEIVLSTDIIAGFPNETEEEFSETMQLIEKVGYDFIYSYTFSPRNGTKAARMKDSLTDEIRKERLHRLQKKQVEIQKKIRSDLVGKVFDVLIEGQDTKHGVSRWQGRSNCMRKIHIDVKEGEKLLWNWKKVKVNKATAFSCYGEIVA